MNPNAALDRGVGKSEQRLLPIASNSSYYDPRLRCTVVATTPRESPALWGSFVDGALRSYAYFGVERALEYDKILDGSSTSLFLAALDENGYVVGGLRAQGPYAMAHHTHADVELSESHVGRIALRRMVAARIAHGVVEMKTVWSAAGRARHAAPGYLGAIGATLIAVLSGCRFTLATSAEHAVDPYLDSGAVMAAHIGAVAYPDHRYRTRVLWWDQHTVPTSATPETRAHIRYAVESLRGGRLSTKEAEAS